MKSKKIALVTGGIRGIGFSICEAFLKKEYKVYVNARSPMEKVKGAFTSLKDLGDAKFIRFDVNDSESLAKAYDSFSEVHLDVLVNNAGILKDNLLCNIE